MGLFINKNGHRLTNQNGQCQPWMNNPLNMGDYLQIVISKQRPRFWLQSWHYGLKLMTPSLGVSWSVNWSRGRYPQVCNIMYLQGSTNSSMWKKHEKAQCSGHFFLDKPWVFHIHVSLPRVNGIYSGDEGHHGMDLIQTRRSSNDLDRAVMARSFIWVDLLVSFSMENLWNPEIHQGHP